MLMPKRVKYRKIQKGRMRGKTKNGFSFAFGEYALKSEGAGMVTDRQIEAVKASSIIGRPW